MNNHAELRLKVLELARDMLNNTYVETKARIHNEWSLKADIAWKTTQCMIPYPKLPEYFTESDVLNRANTLWAFVHAGEIHESSQIPQPMSQPDVVMDSECVNLTHESEQPHNPDDFALIPPPIQLPDAPPTTHMTVAAFVPHTDELPDVLNTPAHRGLKVLPAWMTARRS